MSAPENVPPPVEPVSVVSLAEFISVDEPGAAALVGTSADNLIPEGGDVMFYGDGGTAKTTLTVDLAFHLDAGQEWLGYPVARPARVLLIENEGPRALFREKLRQKVAHWPGAPENIVVWECPWATFTFTDPTRREELARIVSDRQIDVVMAGPVAALGMDAAGTLQEVRAFMALVRDLRARIAHPLTVILVHHENKGGAVSGAWEGAGDTLLHTTAAGPGHTNVFVQKARWASASHHTTLKLTWLDGEGFERTGERDLFAEVSALLHDAKPRTTQEMADELRARKDSIKAVIDAHEDVFTEITGERVRRLGRAHNAKLYLLTRGPGSAGISTPLTGPSAALPRTADSLTPPYGESAVRGQQQQELSARPVGGSNGGDQHRPPDQDALYERITKEDA